MSPSLIIIHLQRELGQLSDVPQNKVRICCISNVYKHYVTTVCADKPNHNLYYDIGTDFCLENPSNTNILLRIYCPLERAPLPDPIFKWTMILNETEMNVEASNLQGLGVHMFSEGNGNIDLNAIIGNYTTITVKCTVENPFGNDTETTIISVCGMLVILFA